MVDEHVIEALGKTRIVVRNGKVVEVGESRLTYCPIFGVTERGRRFIYERMKFIGKPYTSDPDAKQPDNLT